MKPSLSFLLLILALILPAIAQEKTAGTMESVGNRYRLDASKPTPIPIPLEFLDLKTCFELAVLRSETLGMSEADIRIAQARYWQAVAAIMPKVNVIGNQYFYNESGGSFAGNTGAFGPSGGEIFGGGNRTDSRDARVQVKVPIFSGLRDIEIGKAARAEREASRNTRDRKVQQLYLDTAQAFYQVISYQDDLVLLGKIETTLEDRVKDLEKRVKLGKSRQSELLQARTDLAAARVSIEDTKGLLNASRELLIFLTGVEPSQLKVKDPSLAPPRPEAIEKYLAVSGDRPDILAAVQMERSARAQVSAAKGERWPTISATGNYYFYNEPESQQEWNAFITVDLPVFDGGLIEAKVDERREIYTQKQLDLARLRRESVKEVRTAYGNFSSALAELLRLQEAEKTAVENYLAHQNDFELGIINYQDVSISLEQLVSLQRQLVSAQVNARLRLVELHVAAGEMRP